MYPDSLKDVIEGFRYFPGVGQKTAERLAFSILELDEEKVSSFAEA